MRRKVIMFAGAAALTIGAVISSANAQIERGPTALSGQAQNFTRVEKAACGPHLGPVLRPVASPGLWPVSLLVRALLTLPVGPRSSRMLAASRPYPITSSARQPLKRWPYSPVASTTTG